MNGRVFAQTQVALRLATVTQPAPSAEDARASVI
jgi:hypothetical protein